MFHNLKRQMTRFDITTFGESMLRLSVPVGRPLQLTSRLDMNIAGSESNVLAILAQLGHRCSWASSLPENALGRLVANQFRLRGIDLSGVVWKENGRIANYFVEMVAPPRAIQVIYDRENSCVTQMTPAQVDWETVLDTQLIHLSGITPALSAGCHAIVQQAIQQAHNKNIPISFDVNFRSKLWTPKVAAKSLLPLLQGVELLFCAKRDAELLFGVLGDVEAVIEQLAEKTQAKNIIVSIGKAGVVGWDGQQFIHQSAYETIIIDALGAGDALAAGVIHGWMNDDFARGLQMGAALAAMALSQVGDMVVVTQSSLDDLLEKGQRGVRR
jgi:2-dehydro-3-deoxygluconokinase